MSFPFPPFSFLDRFQEHSRSALCAGLNHILELEPEVRHLLKPHAQRTVLLRWPAKGLLPAGELALRITEQALFEPALGLAAPDVTVSIQAGMLAAPESERLRFVRIEGDAMLAQALGLLAKQLRWDYEHDLAQYVGDIPAAWLSRNARAFAATVSEAASRLAANVNEYVVYESGWLATPAQMQAHTAGVAALKNRIETLETKLKTHLKARP